MSATPIRRSIVVLCLLALMTIVLLLLGHRAMDGYVGGQKAKAAPRVLADAGAVSGEVRHADGTPAAGARVTITWTDSAGRPGSTPAIAGEDGTYRQRRLPANAIVTEIRASLGPLVGRPNSVLGANGSRGASAIALPVSFRLAGLVRRADDRSAVAGAAMSVGGVSALSGADGTFAIEGIPAAVITEDRPIVRIAAAGYQPLEWPLPKDEVPEAYGDLTIVLEPLK